MSTALPSVATQETVRNAELSELAQVPRRPLRADDHGPCLIDVAIDREGVAP